MDISQRKIESILESTKNIIYRENFYEFFANIAFKAIFPNKELKPSKSTKILCKIGELSSKRKEGYRKVIVNIPPGLMKSTIISAALPAWHLGRQQSERIFGVSNKDKLVTRNVGWTKLIMETEKYKKVFSDLAIVKDTESHIKTSLGGERQGFGTLSKVTGERCDMLLPDDFISSDMIFRSEGTTALKAWDESFYSRVDKLVGIILIIEQRLGINDLTGYLSRTRPGEYKIISLPAIFEERTVIVLDDEEYVFEAGELLSPDYLPLHELESLRNRVVDEETGIANGKQVFFAQYMQNPVADGGNMVDINWFQPFNISDSSSMKFERVVVSVDSAQKPNEVNDPSAFLKFGMIGKSKYLIDQYCERKVYPETKQALIAFCNNGHRATDLIIEDANTGSSLIQELPNEQKLYGISITPISHGGIKKEIRFSTATGAMSSGTYFFPKDATWYASFESELMQFPKGRHDDRCDCLSQFAHWEVAQSARFNFWCESI